jgi:hypothetical protein
MAAPAVAARFKAARLLPPALEPLVRALLAAPVSATMCLIIQPVAAVARVLLARLLQMLMAALAALAQLRPILGRL